ncbi:MAG: ATPase AAA [Fimbriimonadales bacterium]|nr:MAG: ATPase AAA [Fimbriimonadales bacterium]
MSLFESEAASRDEWKPLAARLRPQTIEQYVGQQHLLGEGAPLRRALESGRIGSMILWGPAGCGKTTLASLLARSMDAHMEERSAVTCGVAEIRKIAAEASHRERRTILFLDEIHHFNRTQQDALLKYVEDGTLILIGATTENPVFSLATPLLSRCRVWSLKPLTEEEMSRILERAIAELGVEVTDEARKQLLRWANGDARVALNGIELAAQLAHPEPRVTAEHIAEAMQRPLLRYDQRGDQHYDVISAFIKSVRGSDVDAALHYLARMLVAGEDPRFIARRLVILASEDVGNADPMALVLATAAFDAVERIGMPEARIPLAQVTIYLAARPKSNSAYRAIQAAMGDLEGKPPPRVPDFLRDPNSRKMETQPSDQEPYLYPHDFGGWVQQRYLPVDHGLSLPYYTPTLAGFEETLARFLEELGKEEEG